MGKRNNRQKKHAKKKEMKKMKHIKKDTGTWVSKQSCHTGHNLVFKTQDGIEVWAGGRNRNGGWHLMNPLPQLAIAPSETLGANMMDSGTDVPEGWSCEQHLTNGTPPQFVSLDWPDFSIPKVNKYFWYALIDDIKEHDIKVISTQCAGGHGRTGTQLAILAHLLLPTEEHAWTDVGQLIEWVREQHCTHAVETTNQQQYIAEVCDIPHGESKIHQSSWGGGWTTSFDPPNYKVADKGKAQGIDGTDDSFVGAEIWDDDFDLCTECGKQSYDWHERECVEIDCKLSYAYEEVAKPTTKQDCPACNESLSSIQFVEGATECISCLAQHLGILSQGKGTFTRYACGNCKGFFKPKDIIGKDSQFGDFVCADCSRGDEQ
tara:strand:- start:5797 stop:6924 length:1128 start_codon:yes stop_codon:yes gene_type:complete